MPKVHLPGSWRNLRELLELHGSHWAERRDRGGKASRMGRIRITIENPAGLLRPGMTVFGRIDFDRQMIGRIILHKLKQALRPELWML